MTFTLGSANIVLPIRDYVIGSVNKLRMQEQRPTEILLIYLFLWYINLRGLFNAKATFVEEEQWYYLSYCWVNKGVYTFPKGISPKVNTMVRLEFELAYYEAVAQHFRYYASKVGDRCRWQPEGSFFNSYYAEV